jgi:hypothetical protein
VRGEERFLLDIVGGEGIENGKKMGNEKVNVADEVDDP